MWYVVIKETNVPVSGPLDSLTKANSLLQHYVDIIGKNFTNENVNEKLACIFTDRDLTERGDENENI